MNWRSSSIRSHRWLLFLVAVYIVSTWCSAVMADDKPAPGQPNSRYGPPAAQPGAPQPTTDVLIRAPRIEVTQPNTEGEPKVLVNGVIVEAMPKEVQVQIRQLQKRRDAVDRDYQEQVKEILKSLPRAAQIDIDRQQLQSKLAEAQAKIADFSNQQNRIVQERVTVSPLPPDAVIKVFSLVYLKPDEAGQVVRTIMGGEGLRIAIDERTNSLLIAGEDKQASIAEALLQKLDQPGADQKGKSAETLQLRLVWIVDGLPDSEGKNVEPPYVSPQVLDGLVDLGFENPRVMCQQVCMLTLNKGNRGGQFQFQLPVLVQGNPWQFEGQGFIASDQSDRYSMQFNLNLKQPKQEGCQLSGSINTPLAHYNVLGTTTFVDEPQGGAMQQHLSAFVVYLDRAREFSEKKATEKAR